MSKKCGNCGAQNPDDASVFCNRCGMRLPAAGPADVTACRKCGNPVTDRQSRFCDRCGSPLTPAVQAVTPAIPAAKLKICPSCGFENSGENLFYCRKCGSYIPKKEPVQKRGPAEKAPVRRPQEGPVRIKPEGIDAVRQKPVTAPVAVRQGPVTAPVAVQQKAVYEPVEAQVPPRQRRQEAPRKRGPGSYRRVGTVAAGVILLVLVIAVIAVVSPGILTAGPANATAPDATTPGLFDVIPWGIIPSQTPVINQATPVVTDTPLVVT